MFLRLFTLVCISLSVFQVYGNLSKAQQNYQQIVGELRSIELKNSTPGRLIVYGEQSTPILTGKHKEETYIVVAASEYGKGKVISVTHEAFIKSQHEKWLKNCIKWMSTKPLNQLTLATKQAKTVKELNQICSTKTLKIGTTKADIWFVNSHQIKDEKEIKDILKHVSNGGGLFISGLGWAWETYFSKGKRLDSEFLGNQLLHQFGVAYTSGTVGGAKGNLYELTAKVPYHLHLNEQLMAIEQSIPKASLTQIEQAILGLPQDHDWIKHLSKKLNHDKTSTQSFIKPIKREHYRDRLAVLMDAKHIKTGDPKSINAHPSVNHFPGQPKGNYALKKKTVHLKTIVPKWNSTGLYAIAGQVFEITIPKQVVGKVTCRVGAHSDKLYHLKEWKRFPEISKTIKLNAEKTFVNTGFGGLIFLEFQRDSSYSNIKVTFDKVIEAPLYQHGITDIKQWNANIKNHPGPWAEIGSDKVIVTVPSEMIRDLDRPDLLMNKWDEILDLCADLSQIDKNRKRPERFVCDKQISAGYMHSGYPIMTWMDQKKNLVDINNLIEGNWGFYHELGHNHQRPSWTFNGTTEVTCNLYSLYVFENICGILPQDYKRTSGKIRDLRVKKYISNPNFELWKSSPFLALDMYVMLQKEFGWQTYKNIFAKYEQMSKEQHPKSDQDKRDQWMVMFSNEVKKDLSDFFLAWGFNLSDSAIQKVSKYKKWESDELLNLN